MINIQHSDVEILIHPKNERRSRVRRTNQSVCCLSSFVVWLPPALGDGARSFAADADARATWGCRDRKSQLFTAVKRVSEDLFFLLFSRIFLYLLEEGFLLLGLLRRGGERSMKLRLESARRVQEAWRLSMLAHSFQPTGGYCRHAAHSRTVSSSDVQLNKQIWGAAGHYFGSFSLPRTQGGNVLFSPTRRFHTEPHIWRLISQQRMSIELPLALRTRRSVADGMVVGTISMKVGRATLRTQARVVTEAGKAEVSRGAKLTMEIRRLGENKSQAMLMYLVAMVAAMVGITYAAVPLYRKFCQATGYGGTIQRRETVEEKIARHKAEESAGVRELVVQFNADVADGMPWKFTPSQREVRVRPGQSTLAFYTAENKSETPITGVSTYNVTPMKAGIYFNKIQCFCFEEQRLLPGEKIDMPVFFYIDPEFATDPKMDNINSLILSYTFFKVEDTPTQS